MPGAYALAMQATLVQGRWPNELLTLALYSNGMEANHANGQDILNDFIVNNPDQRASCHPNAIMFMNIVSNQNPLQLFPNDDVFGLGNGKVDGAAAADVLAGQNALALDNRAIWVKYGLHSFTLITGTSKTIESFEGWAGNPVGYFFHRSVCQEPDDLGYPRVLNSRPTRAQASTALGNLISTNHATRGIGANRLSRAGHGGFGGHHNGDPVPGIDIHVTPTRGLNAIKQEFKRRLTAVGFFRAAAKERLHAGRYYCCHCQAHLMNRLAAQTGRWRECLTCGRHYCRQCKHLLGNHFRFFGIGQLVRICDCGQDTQRI